MSILDQDTIDASGFQKAEDGSLVHRLVIFDHLKRRKRDEEEHLALLKEKFLNYVVYIHEGLLIPIQEKHGLQDQGKRYMIMIVFKYSPSLQGIALLKAMKMEAAMENADLVFKLGDEVYDPDDV